MRLTAGLFQQGGFRTLKLLRREPPAICEHRRNQTSDSADEFGTPPQRTRPFMRKTDRPIFAQVQRPNTQAPLQHVLLGPSGPHAAPGPLQDAASTAVGVTIELTSGNPAAAAAPALLINSRRVSLAEPVRLLCVASMCTSCARSSCSSANQATSLSSGTPYALLRARVISGTLVRPSHRLHTSAAVELRQ